MKMLYATWREPYTTDTAQGSAGQEHASQDVCIFCAISQKNQDSEEFILKRYNYCYLVLNRYPYNPGHLLIIPYAHTQNIYDLSSEAQHELFAVVTKATKIIEKEMKCQGINIGINMGKAAGAGIPAHLHAHILPRWVGDTNFLPTLAGVKTVSSDLRILYEKLLHLF